MSFWSRLFGRTKRGDGGSPSVVSARTAAALAIVGCPFCGGGKVECDPSAPYPYPVWKCTCGAVASGAWLPDLDEVGDQLLEMLGINARVSESCSPAGHPVILMQHYDVNRVERDLAEILTRHGCEFRIALRADQHERLFWVRRNNEKV